MYDPQVVDKIRKGDGKALKQLFKSEYVKLFALAFRLVGDRELVNSMIQGVFKELWHHRQALNPLEPLPKMMQRRIYELASSSDQKGVHVRGLSHDEAPHTLRLIQALETVEPLPRLVYLLHQADGFSYRELAHILDLSEETILHYMGRALSALELNLLESA